MSLKAKIIPIVLAFGFVFVFSANTAFGAEAGDYTYGNPGNATGLIMEGGYYNSGYFEIKFKLISGEQYSGQFQGQYNKAYYPKSNNIAGNFSLVPSFQDQTKSYFMSWTCDSLHTETKYGYDYCVLTRDGSSLVMRPTQMKCSPYDSLHTASGSSLTKTEIDGWCGSDFLENKRFYDFSQAYDTGSSISHFDDWYNNYPSLSLTFPYGSSSPVDGVCGSANGQVLTTIPPSSGDACSAGNFVNFGVGYDELGTALNYSWLCEGVNGGSSTACASANVVDPVNGVCGSANNQTVSAIPAEYERCSTGDSRGSILQTLTGWTWSCYGYNAGTTASCSATYQEAETPPTIPDSADIPTPTDCNTFSGIDKVLCNFGNTIQGMFLPSASKITELQNTVNKINSVFPFNYLRAIGTIFTNASNITEGGLTMTIMGNTATLNEGFYDLSIIEKIKDFFTFLIYLAFVWWAIGYIKHFFK